MPSVILDKYQTKITKLHLFYLQGRFRCYTLEAIGIKYMYSLSFNKVRAILIIGIDHSNTVPNAAFHFVGQYNKALYLVPQAFVVPNVTDTTSIYLVTQG